MPSMPKPIINLWKQNVSEKELEIFLRLAWQIVQVTMTIIQNKSDHKDSLEVDEEFGHQSSPTPE